MKHVLKVVLGLGLICALFVGLLYVRNDIGVTSANLEADTVSYTHLTLPTNSLV